MLNGQFPTRLSATDYINVQNVKQKQRFNIQKQFTDDVKKEAIAFHSSKIQKNKQKQQPKEKIEEIKKIEEIETQQPKERNEQRNEEQIFKKLILNWTQMI